MPKNHQPRRGSLQFYPRVRAKKILPRVNWNNIKNEEASLLGFIGYKVGMKSAYVKDDTPHSHTKGKRMIIPVTILECPTIKIFSIRFYKNNKVIKEVLNDNFDKELKKKLRLPKQKTPNKKLEDVKEEEYDDLKVIAYSQVKKTGIKKKPDISEIGLSGTLSDKLQFIKDHLKKEISIKDIIKEGIVDIRGVTKGKGTQGPTKRFGLSLKVHKAEKGQRGPGSGGPWHPSRVTFREPRAGQMGYFTRVLYNNKIIQIRSINENDINPKNGFKKYGKIKTDYAILFGSVQGPSKRQLILTRPIRPSKKQSKKNFEFIELR